MNTEKLISCWSDSKKVYSVTEDVRGKRLFQTHIVDWYFAVKLDSYKAAKEIISNKGFKVKAVKDKKYPGFVKLYVPEWNRWDLVDELEKNGIPTYEGDLSLARRWYIDKQFEISDNYKILYFDIETDDSNERIEIGKDRILSFAAIDNEGKKFFTYMKTFDDKGEREMLEKVLKLLDKYDIITGWNTFNFDIPYIKARAKYHNLHKTSKYYTWNHRANFDALDRMRHTYRFDSGLKGFSLEYISQHFLGRGKIKHDETIIELYRTNLDKLKEYNLEDCVLVKEIDEKLKITGMQIKQSQWCKVPAKDFGLYSIIDAFILNTAHQVGKFERTSRKALNDKLSKDYRDYTRMTVNPDATSTEKEKYFGGLVLDPVVGLYKRVYVFDFKSLYPSMMKTSNIGLDALQYHDDGKCIINPGTKLLNRKSGVHRPTFFRKEKSTIFLAISELMTRRKEYKKLKFDLVEQGKNDGPEWDKAVSDEIVVKELANSTYGIMGLEFGRYYNVDIAESITLFGQWMILNAKEFFESQGHKALYGDTDSIFISTEEPIDVHAILDKYHAYLADKLKKEYRIDESFIELEFDKEYDGFILIAKKTYCGKMINYEGKKVDKMYARGLEFIKRGTFGYGTVKQKALAEFLFTYPSEREVRLWLLDVKKDFYNTKFDVKDLTITNKIGKSLNEYSGKKDPLHVQIAKRIYEKTGEFYRNQEVEYIITNSDKGLKGIPASEFKGDFDRDYYWENRTVPLLKRLTEPCFPRIDFDMLYNENMNLFDDM